MSEQKIHITNQMLDRTQSLMLHGVGFVSGDPTVRISKPYVFHPGVQIIATEPGYAKWIYMMLPINRGSLITDIKIAQHRVGIESRISIIRLVEQKEPTSATVVHDYKIENTLSPTTGTISTGCKVIVNNSILLKVCLDFLNTEDIIEIGSVEIRYIPEYVSLSEADKMERNGSRDISNSITGSSYNEKVKRPSLADLIFKKQRKNIISNN